MHRYKLTIEYDGSKFHGFQKQTNCITVQTILEQSIFNFCHQKAEVIAAGRTDAGVHALGQVVHFDMGLDLPLYRIQDALNFYTRPYFLAVVKVEKVDNNFHARFSAKEREYRYIILNRRSPSPLFMNQSWHIKHPLNYENMHCAAQFLVGKHDFTSFRAIECQAASPIKTLTEIKVYKEQDFIYIDVKAPSFLHHMVRNIVGSLKLVGNEKWSVEDFIKIFQAKNRSLAGETAPPWGLYFIQATYTW